MRHRSLFVLAAVAGLAACQPALNWRTVPVDAAGISIMLPCKPEHASRTVEMGMPVAVELAMVGCDADGATFALSHLRIDEPAQANATLAMWQRAVSARMQAESTAGAGLPSPAAFVPSGALAVPNSLRAQLRGRGADGRAVTAHAVWFARLEGAHARLFHAVVYSATPRGDAVQAFVDGLRLQ